MIVLLFDLPAHLFQLLLDCCFVLTGSEICLTEVVFPYGAVYLSTSSRDFWQKWSRPAGQLIRRMVYIPVKSLVGGREYIAIPVLFMVNASSHFDVGRALVGDSAAVWWTAVFGIAGLAVLLEISVSLYCLKEGSGSEDPEVGEEAPEEKASPSCRFRIGRAVFAHCCLRVVVYIFVHKCLHLSLASFAAVPDT